MADTVPYDVVSGEAPQVKMPYSGLEYDISKSLGDTTKADLVKGYCSYGKSTGEKY